MAKSKQQLLDELQAKIVADGICPELAKAATKMVFGAGSADAELVFIGEAPGKNEDLTGLPFVGASGKVLDEMLASIGLTRDDVYITSILKYRPPNNRDPLPAEKAAFLPYMQAQLDIIRPLLVVTLGRHSTNCFLPDLHISTAHGQPKRLGGQVYLPLFHPAAALYNTRLRQTLMDDFAKIPNILMKIKATSAAAKKEPAAR